MLADLVKRRLRLKIPILTEALRGRFTEHHAFLARTHLGLIDQFTQAITQITERVQEVIKPFQAMRELLCSIPGISTLTADAVVARDRCGHDLLPNSEPSGLLGRHHPRQQ